LNFIEISKITKNYSEINREERNYAAILFAALCKPSNSLNLLNELGFKINELGPDYGIYFEYSYLRDLWFQIEGNETKKEIIRQLLKINGIDSILNKPIADINRFFGTSNPSKKHIESPSNWAITRYYKGFDNANIVDNYNFLKVCLFKWSFNIKPDIVIHIDKNNALCIEAKYKSKESTYPGTQKDQKIYDAKIKSRVSQLTVQRHMMENILGIKTKFLFLVPSKTEKQTSSKAITWKEVFDL